MIVESGELTNEKINRILKVTLVISIILCCCMCIVFKKSSGYSLVRFVNYTIWIFEKPKEYHDTNRIWCQNLRNNYLDIRQEYLDYIKNHQLARFKDVDKTQTKYDISDIPWQVLFLKVYNVDTDKTRFFPKTTRLISQIPGCTLAMFSVLHSGKVIPPHRGPYKGVLRYHLTLIAPKDHHLCTIHVNKKPYNWTEGTDVLFDDTYLHHVENKSSDTRVILFLDIKKDFNNIFLDSLNSLLLNLAKYNDTVDSIKNNS